MIEPIFADSLKGLEKFFEEMPAKASTAARMAINDVAAGRGLAILRAKVQADINFPAGYLNNTLAVTKKANDNDLTAVIQGRDRPTSLARFAPGQTPENTRKAGVRVMVKPGQSKLLQKAFLIHLRNGNIGLALRLKPGEVLHNKREVDAAVKIGNGLYLLYGPSVDQVFKWTATDSRAEIASMVAAEFLRQFARL